MRNRVLTVLLVGTALAGPVSGQFSFGSVGASAGYEGIFDPPGSLTPISSATYRPNGMMAFLDKEGRGTGREEQDQVRRSRTCDRNRDGVQPNLL